MGKVNKSRGNMYPWATHTWSPGRGCPHQCLYCYVRDFGGQPAEFKPDLPFPPLGRGRKIFVGHMCDLFAAGVPEEMTQMVLVHVNRYPLNQYIFQTKAPLRALAFADRIQATAIIGTTIETNWDSVLLDYVEKDTTLPVVADRAEGLRQLRGAGYQTFLTIEPLIDFHPDEMISMAKLASPSWINIGADSKGHGLPEPEPEKVLDLISRLRAAGFEVRIKENLRRLLPGGIML